MSRAAGGALVISLDFELHWGVRDHRKLSAAERERLLTARRTVPEILSAFRDHSVHATWATVGLLFARSREEALELRPERMPRYEDVSLDPYVERVGRDESDDPFHYAPSLIAEIAREPGQEIGSHSFSHYYSLEAGQSADEFKSDLDSAKRIAEYSGHELRSYVFPRNQVRAPYLPLLQQAGFRTYRGTEPSLSKLPATFRQQRKPWLRALRLMDAYVNLNGPQTTSFPETDEWPAPLPASRYLRPYTKALRPLERKRLQRIENALEAAARERRIFHLWWHPEDFAADPGRNIDFLRSVLVVFERCRREFGMASLSMEEAAGLNESCYEQAMAEKEAP